jgi:hypothetical protein
MDIRYSYAHVPTIREFAASNARVRGLSGPFRCLSGDTEFLTPCGWKRIDAFQDGDLVAQWRDGAISFVEPLDYIVDKASEFIEFSNRRSLTMRLSPGHRVPHYNWAGAFTVLTAAEIERHPSRRTMITTFDGHENDALGLSDDMIRFAVMMHADGSYPKQGKKAVISVRKDRKKQRIRELLTRMAIPFAEYSSKTRPETTFRFLPPYRGKRFDGAWWKASKRELAIVLDEMPYWDGLFDNDVSIFASAYKIDADYIQYAAHANGLRASISIIEGRKENWRPQHRVSIRMGDNQKNRACIREGTEIKRIPSGDGKMYCFTVPSGFFLARCNDSIFVTGNSGKSSGCVVEIVRRALAQKPGVDGIKRTRWLVVRSTYRELSDTTIRTVQMWLPPQHFGRYYQTDNRYVVKGFQGAEFEILFRALDKPDDIANLLSLEITGAWVNEAREIPWAIVDAIQGRIEQYPTKAMGGCTWAGLFMDTNPPDQDSDWYRFFEEKKHPKWFAELFKQPSGLSPQAENIPNLTNPNYYKLLAEGKKPEWLKVYIHGEYGFVVDGKPVYDEYSDQLHRREVDPVPSAVIRRGWDFGLTPACCFSQLLPDGRWLVFDEMTSKNMSIDQFSDDVLEHCRRSFRGDVQFQDDADPAGNQRAQTDKRTCFEIAGTKGIQMEPVRKPLRTLIGGEPQFILHPRCLTIRKGFLGGYNLRRIQVAGPERYASRPDKQGYSHIMNAMEYSAAQLFAPALTRGPPNGDGDWPDVGYDGGMSDQGRSPVTGY